MRKSRFTEAQIIGILKELKAGKKAASICRERGSARRRCTTGARSIVASRSATWSGSRQLEDENRRLKKIVADQALNIEALKAGGEGTF